MFDIYIENINLSSAAVIFSLTVLLPAQIVLTLKTKKRIWRLAPALFFLTLTLLLAAKAVSMSGFSGLGYMILAVYCATAFLVCIVGLILRYFIRKRTARR